MVTLVAHVTFSSRITSEYIESEIFVFAPRTRESAVRNGGVRHAKNHTLMSSSSVKWNSLQGSRKKGEW